VFSSSLPLFLSFRFSPQLRRIYQREEEEEGYKKGRLLSNRKRRKEQRTEDRK
jgi:hypothetical protein